MSELDGLAAGLTEIRENPDTQNEEAGAHILSQESTPPGVIKGKTINGRKLQLWSPKSQQQAPSQPESRVRIWWHKTWRQSPYPWKHVKSQELTDLTHNSLSSQPHRRWTFCFFHNGAWALACFFFSTWIKLALFSLRFVLGISPGWVKDLVVASHWKDPRPQTMRGQGQLLAQKWLGNSLNTFWSYWLLRCFSSHCPVLQTSMNFH